jgi:glycine/D-amino acid oxidase-like deaminating enzyme/nitrite reductase/ring-hydroxylating ferredoxin subunit
VTTTLELVATASYWSERSLGRYPHVERSQRFDAVVIGGGITGITAAYLLKREGRKVALVERQRIGGVDTTATSAHLTCVTDTRLTQLARRFGDEHARAVWDAGFAAINQIDEIVKRHNIDCSFAWVPGYLHAPVATRRVTDRTRKILQDEAALATRLGFDVQELKSVPFVDRPGIEISHQARFRPPEYLHALLEEIQGGGSRVFEHSDATEVTTDPLCVMVRGHKLRCDDVIVATHDPIVGRASFLSATLLQTKLSLYTSYVLTGRIASGAVPDALFWDTGDPYQYIRLDPRNGTDAIIFGGEDHKTGQVDDTRDCFARLESQINSRISDFDVTHRWSGQVIETPDGLPYIGYAAPHQFAATGFSGNGMTFGTLAAMMAADAIAGRTNPWQKLFDIHRKKLSSVWDYLVENKDYPYYLVRDRFAGAEGKTTRGIARDSGQVIEMDGQKLAVYRDKDGTLTKRSAICTHMGCVVAWNAAERTWDCPCHGSRFEATGRVLSGPAETDLSEPTPKK